MVFTLINALESKKEELMKGIKNIIYSMLLVLAALLVMMLTRLDLIIAAIRQVIGVLTPFLVGFIVAYILNIPYMFFMNRAFVFMDKPPVERKGKLDEFLARLRKPLSLILSFAIFFAAVFLLLSIIIPQITSSIQGVIDNFGVYYENISNLKNCKITKYLEDRN